MNIVRRMLLLAEMIPASELQTQGYLLATYEADQLGKEADALAQRLAKLAPITQKASKLIMARLIASQLPDCQDLIRETYGSNDFRNGVASFLKGEPPVWTGK
jgi:enoyl-CoA hydratase